MPGVTARRGGGRAVVASEGGEEAKATVADAGAIPPLVALLQQPGEVRLKAAGALGTLAHGW